MLEWLASDIRSFVQDVLAFSICLAAFVWGAGPERAMVAVWLVCFEAATRMYAALSDVGFQLATTDPFLALTDGGAAVLWTFVALNANRNYPLIVAALQLLVMAAHLSRGLIEAISPVAYIVMVVAPGWLQLLVMATGVSRHIWRERSYGPYREWRVPVRWFGLLPAAGKGI